MPIKTDPQTLLFVALASVAGVVALLATIRRARAEEARLKLLQAQLAEQPLRQAVLQARHDAVQRSTSDITLAAPEPSGSLLRRARVSADATEADPLWDSLLQFVDQQ
jgi:hypothetical protein